MAVPPLLILGGAGALLYFLLSGEKSEEEEDDMMVSSRDIEDVINTPTGVVNGTCPGYTAMGMAEAQGILKKLNYKGADGKALAADGTWGSNTKFAMSDYQKTKGLTVDGYLGKQTGDALKNSLTADIVGPPPAADANAVSKQFGYKDGFESKGAGYNFTGLCTNIGSGCNETSYNAGFCDGARDAGIKEGSAAHAYGPDAAMSAFNGNGNACWKEGFKKGYKLKQPLASGAVDSPLYSSASAWGPIDPIPGGSAEPKKPSPDQQAFMEATGGNLQDAINAGIKGEIWAKVGATVDMRRQGVVMARAARAGADAHVGLYRALPQRRISAADDGSHLYGSLRPDHGEIYGSLRPDHGEIYGSLRPDHLVSDTVNDRTALQASLTSLHNSAVNNFNTRSPWS